MATSVSLAIYVPTYIMAAGTSYLSHADSGMLASALALALALFFAYSMLDIAIADDKRGQDCYRKHKHCKLSDHLLSLDLQYAVS